MPVLRGEGYVPAFLPLVLRGWALTAAYARVTHKYGTCRVSGPSRRIVTARLALLGALALLPALWTQSSHAECRINGVEFDVGGRPGSGVITINRSNPIALSDLKNWAEGDDVSTCDVSGLTHLDAAFNENANFNDPIGTWPLALSAQTTCSASQPASIETSVTGIPAA